MPILTSAMKLETYKAIARDLVCDECGQDLIEYALIALGAVASMKTLGGKVGTAFTSIGTSVTSNI